ncbi:MAG: HAD family hydrolase [Caldilineaceae bacterium]|nr:HAD family hydrolase [Caldilineaceae bacterium]
MLKAIIFDFDGTIIETETPDYQSWQELFVEHGCDLAKELWCTYIGTASGTFDPYRLLAELSGGDIDRPALRTRRRRRFHELVAQQPSRPGVEALLAAATAQGIPLAIASSSTRDWVEEHLAARHLRHYFQAVYTANDVTTVKPDPTLYRLAARALQVEPTQALAVEDSLNGLLAAKRAGLKCVVTPHGMTAHMAFAEADLVLTSLAEITLAQLLAL